MAIRWKIPFKTLRAGTLLTVNVYDSTYTGNAVILKGAAQPFETQEENSDDVFLNVRKQSGYLRIVDDGFAADSVTAFNWRDFIPTTDVDRPVTLTDANDNVLWQGFLQAQNFGAALFGNPQNREFPVQCSLSVTKGINIPTDQYSLHNFAYLIFKLIDSIPTPCKPQTVVIQGDAVNWLTKRVDWMNFVEKDDNGVTTAKYKLYDVLEEMCKFWGWTARTNARTLYLVSPDDNTSQLVTIPYIDIVTLASNIAINPPQESDYTSVTIDGGFSGSDDKDYQMRGISKATFDPDTNTADTNVIETFDHQLDVDMDAEGLDPQPYYTEDGHYMKTYDILTIDRLGFTAEATSGYASFNRIMRGKSADEGYGYDEPFDVIMFKKSYDGTTSVTMQTKYMHSFCDGFFRMVGDTYKGADKFQEGDFFAGNKFMWMRFGVGTSRANAKWWNGKQWGDTSTTFRATIGNQTPEIFSRYQTGSGFDIHIETVSIINTETMYGYLFVDFLGSDNFDEYSGERAFNIKDFRIEFRKNNTVVKQQFPNSGWYKLTDKELKTVTYKSENNNAIEEDASIDSIFASEKVMKPGYGIVLNINGSYLTTVAYGAAEMHPEQHYVDRITNYWSTSKRKIEANLLTHDGSASTVANGVTPGHMVMIDGTKLYPIAISHKWRDDEVGMKCMEMSDEPPVKKYDVLEYIAVDQEGYYGVIDTGITGSKNIKIEADYMLTAHRATISAADGLFGTETAFTNNSFTFMAEVNAQGRAYFCLGNTNKQVNGLSLDTKYHVVAGTTFTLNGNTQTLNPGTFSTPQTIRIFSIGRVNMAETTASFLGRLYSLKIYNGSTLVRDYEPRRRNSDNMVSLYDKVNDAFYLPDNGIPYVAGPVVEE